MKATYNLSGLRRQLGKRVETEDGRGFTTVPDGHEVCSVQLTADLDALTRRLADKAMRNKGGKATIAWGLVVVRVTSRKREV